MLTRSSLIHFPNYFFFQQKGVININDNLNMIIHQAHRLGEQQKREGRVGAIVESWEVEVGAGLGV